MLDTKKILSRNVSQLLDTRADTSRLKLSKQMGVADGTLGRIKYGTGNPNIETLEAIARFFRVQPWHLLIEDFDIKSLPKLASKTEITNDLSQEEKDLIATVRALREPERTYLLQQAKTYKEAMNPNSGIANKSQIA